MSGYKVHVTGLSPETSEEKVKDFFLFCGAITTLSKDSSTATITFQKESAAKTALMLNGGTLDGHHLEVTSAAEGTEATGANLPKGVNADTPIGAATLGDEHDHPISQEDKPKAGIMAEYLAAGYHISDLLIQRAIEVDHKQGISQKFLGVLNKVDHKVGSTVTQQADAKASAILGSHVATATTKAKEFDEKKGITSVFLDYYSKALNTNAGQKVLQFYTTTTKQVKDVHDEAKRISIEKKAVAGTSGAAHDVAPGLTETVDQAAAKVPVSTSAQ